MYIHVNIILWPIKPKQNSFVSETQEFCMSDTESATEQNIGLINC
jgi:hypothetical protein